MSVSVHSTEGLCTSVDTHSDVDIASERLPLCVELDRTLVLSNLLLESVILLIKRNPLYLFCLPLWLFQGRAVLKSEVAARVALNPAALPYNRELIDWITTERRGGRHLWLCTASDRRLAITVASYLGLFDGIVASDRSVNLAGEIKAARLLGHFGSRRFDYCGNARQDVAIWKHAHAAIVVNGGRELEAHVGKQALVLRSFPSKTVKTRAVLRSLRPHQWAKNALILLPLLAAHRVGDLKSTSSVLLAFVAFCACASSVYILNDLLDLEADRANPRKSKRPFAAGDLSLLTGFALAPTLLCSAFALAAFLPISFLVVLTIYYVLTLAYSFRLKGLVLIDTLTLASLYTLRIVAGGAAGQIPISFWMLLFSVFLFLSLALVKRFAELDILQRQNQLRAVGRGYEVADLPMLRSLGSAAGYLSVLVLALYINSQEIETLYRQPKVIWILCVLLLFWISRVWMMAQRGGMHDDPVVFALKDPVSLGVGVLVMLSVLLAM